MTDHTFTTGGLDGRADLLAMMLLFAGLDWTGSDHTELLMEAQVLLDRVVANLAGLQTAIRSQGAHIDAIVQIA